MLKTIDKIANSILKSIDIIKEVDNENEVKTNKYARLIKLLNTNSDKVLKAIENFLIINDDTTKKSFLEFMAEQAPTTLCALFKLKSICADYDLMITTLMKKSRYEFIANSKDAKEYIEFHKRYTAVFEGFDQAAILKFLDVVKPSFHELDMTKGKDDIFNHIVERNYYQLNVCNIKIVLDIDETNLDNFETLNYSFIKNSTYESLRQRVEHDLNTYVEQILLKLPNTKEDESVIVDLLKNEEITLENKKEIIGHLDTKIEDLRSFDNEELLSAFFKENTVIPSWDNILYGYKTFEFGEELKEFLSENAAFITGSTKDSDFNLVNQFFNALLEKDIKPTVLEDIAKRFDCVFNMNESYANNINAGAFIRHGTFAYNVTDFKYLASKSNQFHYIFRFQDKIIGEMETFFGNHIFSVLFVESLLNDKDIRIDFKKEFIKKFGNKIEVSITVATFIIDNSCGISEELLYKFTPMQLDQILKLSLLALAIEQNIITDLTKYKSYFSSIGPDYQNLYNADGKLELDDTEENKRVSNFMKNRNIVSSRKKDGKIVLRKVEKTA